ncbi:iron donor protein CyaY [Oxalicibacterium solurbis]|uniref:Iron-sulfur cluster assembly protein CyaY n=1 Tax=Oxalicibacterium solurbis TaxID=69280 RepID=A0A8J3AXP2_9BURK|nr:iron donor protein CyaY [Oxalicibacterium solurbis]GGI54817.1 protein CyaY [Oxalicibacterium solurbis]
MTESEFLEQAEAMLGRIEAALERANDSGDLDVECSRNGNVLEIEFIDNGTKIIVNSQAAMQELWVAAKSGGFHFKSDGTHWIGTRDGAELLTALSKMVSEQGGAAVTLN